MPPQTLARRVDILEHRVTALEEFPAHLEALRSQFSQLREEMVREFSAVRAETARQIQEANSDTQRLMRILHEDLISRLALLKDGATRPPKRTKRR
jgi:hypothetical protein